MTVSKLAALPHDQLSPQPQVGKQKETVMIQGDQAIALNPLDFLINIGIKGQGRCQ